MRAEIYNYRVFLMGRLTEVYKFAQLFISNFSYLSQHCATNIYIHVKCLSSCVSSPVLVPQLSLGLMLAYNCIFTPAKRIFLPGS